MRNLITLFTILLLQLNAKALDRDSINYRIFNIGNIVDIKNKPEFSHSLKGLISSSSEPTLLILNGDLIKKNKSNYLGYDSLNIYNMLKVFSTIPNCKTIVIPGDRDWNNSGKNGLEKVNKLENLIEHKSLKNVKWVLDNGCPGPILIELDSNLLFMAINTQWWNHPHDKPTSVDGLCKINTKKDFILEFENALSESEDKNLIIAGHFPLVIQRKPSFKDFILPLPILGSFTASFHQNIGGHKDIVNDLFNSIRKKLLKKMSLKQGVVYLSGHYYNTQIIKEEKNYFINNGLPNKSKKNRGINTALYSSTSPEITEVVYYSNGKISSNIYSFINSKFQLKKEVPLYRSVHDFHEKKSTKNSTNLTPYNYSNKYFLSDVSNIISKKSDTSLFTSAGNYNARFIKKLFIGNHYRTSWNATVEAPILNMDTTKGGLKIYNISEGHQTTSVKMYGQDGYAYTFRSVNKDATRGLGGDLIKSLIARQLQDNVSMQHPYGGLIVSKLLDNTSILHAQPKLYMLPKSDNLSRFSEYGGLLGTLEDHPKKSKKVKNTFANADKILQSHQLNKKLYENYNHKVDAKEYTKARVFDILVNDFGKHQDNWKWAGYKSDTGTIYRPIPRDRDLVFAKRDGILPWIADREWMLKSGENFGYKIIDIKSLMWAACHPDRFLTNEMDKQDWLDASNYIKHQITDSVIHTSILTLPKEIQSLSGTTIEAKLNTRIKDLDRYTLQYYMLLAKQVDVTGSNKPEYFEILRNKDNSVDISIFNIKKNSTTLKGEKLIYHRKFILDETKEIRIYGLGSIDVFNISGSAKKSIKLIIIGGDGADIIADYSKVNGINKLSKIYENNLNSQINLGTEARMVKTWNANLYDFQPSIFEYNRYIPIASASYSIDNGYKLGGGVQFTKKEKFGNIDFSAKHRFLLEASTKQNNIFRHYSRYHNMFRKWDLEFGTFIAHHNNLTNFFGIGNNTEKNDSLVNTNYYKTTYNTYSFNIGVIRSFWKKSSFSLNSKLEHNTSQIGENSLVKSQSALDNNFISGTTRNNILISSANLEIDFRDKKDLPEKGIRSSISYKNGLFTTDKNNFYHILTGNLEHLFTVYIPSPVTLGLKTGGSISSGKIPFYKLNYLGNNSYLRGFSNNRFTGKSTLFVNTELRVQLKNFTTTFIPIKLGFKAFFDTGRVYSSFDKSELWHNGYGAGIYSVFLDERYTANLSFAYSKEENNLIIFSLGKSFN
jgi:hypothetical protein